MVFFGGWGGVEGVGMRHGKCTDQLSGPMYSILGIGIGFG